MARNFNTDVNGKPFIDLVKKQVWNNAKECEGFSKEDWRYDICGNPMKGEEYGNRNNKYGWEIDHIKPVAKGGTDDLSNLQALNWKNNAVKTDKYPWKCGE